MKTDLQAKQTAEKETSLSVNEVSAKEQNQIILYRPNDTISLEVRLENDTVWLTQDMMSDLFLRDKSTISRHIKNIFQEKELQEESVVAKFATTDSSDGKIYQVDYYNLDVDISRLSCKKYSWCLAKRLGKETLCFFKIEYSTKCDIIKIVKDTARSVHTIL